MTKEQLERATEIQEELRTLRVDLENLQGIADKPRCDIKIKYSVFCEGDKVFRPNRVMTQKILSFYLCEVLDRIEELEEEFADL